MYTQRFAGGMLRAGLILPALFFAVILLGMVAQPALPANRETITAGTADRVEALQTIRGNFGLLKALGYNAEGELMAFLGGFRERRAFLWNLSHVSHSIALQMPVFGRPRSQFTHDLLSDVIADQQGQLLYADGGLSDPTYPQGTYDPWTFVWDINSGELVFPEPHFGFSGIGFSQDGRYSASIRMFTSQLRVHDEETGQWVTTDDPFNESNSIYTPVRIAFNNDNRLLAIGDLAHIHIWDIRTQETVIVLEQFYPLATGQTEFSALMVGVAFSPDGTLLASTNLDGFVWLWDAETLTGLDFLYDTGLLDPIPISVRNRQSSTLRCITFNSDSSLLATCRGTTILLWDVAHRTLAAVLQSHDAIIHNLFFAPGGDLLVSSDRANTIRFWGVRG